MTIRIITELACNGCKAKYPKTGNGWREQSNELREIAAKDGWTTHTVRRIHQRDLCPVCSKEKEAQP